MPREPNTASERCRQAGPEWAPRLPTTVHILHPGHPSGGHTARELAVWIFVVGLSELLPSDPWVGQMEEGGQGARAGEQQLGLQ